MILLHNVFLRRLSTTGAGLCAVILVAAAPAAAQQAGGGSAAQASATAPADLGTVSANGTASGSHRDQQVGMSGPPVTASQLAPSRPSLDQTQPTSTISAETIQKTNAPIADYDDIVTLTPSAMNINPAGPGLQQDFGQSIRGL